MGAAEFFTGPLECSLHEDELAVSATFPHPRPATGSSWVEVSRRHGDYALVGVGALVTLDGDGHVTAASVVLISVAGSPVVVDLSDVAAGVRRDGDGDGAAWAGADDDPRLRARSRRPTSMRRRRTGRSWRAC